MTATHWHLIVNHLPIIGTTLSTFLLLAGILLKNRQLQLISVSLIFVMSVFGFIAHETGEKAERAVKQEQAVTDAALEAHEEAAKPAFLVHNIAGLLAIIALIFSKKAKLFNALGICMVVVALTAAGLMSYAGYLGGKIRHSNLNGPNQTYNYYEMNLKEGLR
jgi:uncharacterized membrane protein